MKDLIKEVALSVWASQENAADTRSGDQIITEFATVFLAELSKRAEAVATVVSSGELDLPLLRWVSANTSLETPSGAKLFTFPPIHDIEAIENRTAEACAKAIRFADNGTEAAEILRQGEWREHK